MREDVVLQISFLKTEQREGKIFDFLKIASKGDSK
jgi:hypothetical protein